VRVANTHERRFHRDYSWDKLSEAPLDLH
jgi:hypothetical protein